MIDKKKWFEMPDSSVKDAEGKHMYFNVEGRFADQTVLDPEASRKARHSVYFYMPVFHTRVIRVHDGERAIPNASSIVLRFDKGFDETQSVPAIGPDGTTVMSRVGKDGLHADDIAKYIAAIKRSPEAWEHYQKFRKSSVTELEQYIVARAMQSPHDVKKRGANGEVLEDDDILEQDMTALDPDQDIDPNIVIVQPPSAVVNEPAKRRGRPRKAA